MRSGGPDSTMMPSSRKQTVTVTGESGDGYPAGTVAVYSSSTLLCSSSLGIGSGDVATGGCVLSATELAAGSYSDLFASFTPAALSSSNSSYTYIGSNSAAAKKLTAVALSLTSPTIYGEEGSATVKVTVSATGTTPAGTVTVEADGTTMCAVALGANGSGTCAPSASKLAPGTYFVVALYAPATSNFVASLSLPVTFTVKRAGTSIVPSLVATLKSNSESLQFGGTLTSSVTGLPVAGRALLFTLNSHGAPSCSAVTNASGRAACSMTVSSNVFKSATTYSASFGGDADYLASTLTAKTS
jgi:hypothetical protein